MYTKVTCVYRFTYVYMKFTDVCISSQIHLGIYADVYIGGFPHKMSIIKDV